MRISTKIYPATHKEKTVYPLLLWIDFFDMWHILIVCIYRHTEPIPLQLVPYIYIGSLISEAKVDSGFRDVWISAVTLSKRHYIYIMGKLKTFKNQNPVFWTWSMYVLFCIKYMISDIFQMSHSYKILN